MDVARGIDLESDASYNNDTIANADVLTLTPQGNSLSATIAGTIMSPEGSNTDEDYFSLGTLNVGNIVDLTVELPSYSTLIPKITLVNSSGTVIADEDGNDSDNNYQATITTDGDYYAKMDSYWAYNGSLYLITSSNLTWEEAQTLAVNLGGNLVTINDEAENTWLNQTFSRFGDFWIGLNDVSTEGSHEWASGEAVTYTNWASGEPNTASYDHVYMNTNGQWQDIYSTWTSRAVIEIDDPENRDYAGPGSEAQYILTATVTDAIAPEITSISGLPGDGETSNSVINRWTVNVSETLDADTVNSLSPIVYEYGGNYYLLTPTTSTWTDAQAYAESLGGNLVTINSEAEQNWLWDTFGWNQDVWIGMNDETTEGTWEWVSGETVDYTNWAGSEPNSGSNYDYGYMNDSDGQWYDGYFGWEFRGIVELSGVTDSDGDGIPDIVDSLPNDALNYWQLEDTDSGEYYRLALDTPYTGGTSLTLRVVDGPLGEGNYRFTANSTLTDLASNALDGDGDGTGGDAYVQDFSIDLPEEKTFEGRNNNTFGNATALSLTEDPSNSGYYYSFGLGSIDPDNDVDYWSFEALAGDKVSISMDTPESGLNPYVYLRNSSNSNLNNDNRSGPDNDSFISSYTISQDGTYYIVADNASSTSKGNYQIRVDVARGIDLESDAEYNNDSISNADVINLTTVEDHQVGTIAGNIMASSSNNVDEDYFNLGIIEAGKTIFLNIDLPSTSELQPVVEIRDNNNQIVTIAPNPSAAVARADIDLTGTYYAVVLATGGAGPQGQYLLDAAIWDTGAITYADLAVNNISPSTNAANSGEEITVNWTVRNYGTGITDNASWFDRLILSSNDTYGDADDIFLASVQRNGTLDVDEEYTAQATVELPLDISGDYWLFVATDQNNQVFEYIFENNNVTQDNEQLNVTLTDYADLEVSNVDTNTDSSISGEEVTVTWTVENVGIGITGNGQPGGTVDTWNDRIVLSINSTFGDGDDVFLSEVTHTGALNDGDSYDGSWTGVLPADLEGDYQVLVFTDWGNAVYEYINTAANVASAINPITVAPEVYGDLQVTDVTFNSPAIAGEALEITYTITNSNNAWADTPISQWYDRVVLSEDDIYGNGDDRNLGTFVHNGVVAKGDSYTATQNVNIPGNVLGDRHLFVVSDIYNYLYEFTYENNNASTAQPITIEAPDLIIENTLNPPTAPDTILLGENVTLSWDVLNQGVVNASADWYDRVYLSDDETLDGSDQQIAIRWSGSDTPLAPNDTYSANVTVTVPNNATLGHRFLLFVADSSNSQAETDETNNLVAIPVTVDALAVDLVVSDISAPPEGVSGQSVTLNWTVTNDGTDSISKTWTDRIYLSNDANIGSDIYVRQFTYNDTLDAGELVQRSETFTLPSNLTGEYRFVVTTDIYNQVVELNNENNNSRIDDIPIDISGNPGVISFNTSQVTVNEETGQVQLTVTRTGGSFGSVTVDYATNDGDAIAPEDYTNTSNTITFANGDSTAKTITIPIVDDSNYELTENFTVTLSNPSGGATLGSRPTTTINILDNDAQPGVIEFSEAEFAVNENGQAVNNITLVRTGGSDGSVTVRVTPTNGSATSPSDYNSNYRIVTFGDGITTQNFAIPIVQDADEEPDETINLTLSDPTGGVSIGTQNTATLTIIDDDFKQTLTLSLDETEVNEGDGIVTATISRNTDTSSALVVSLYSSKNTQVAVPPVVTIPMDSESTTFDISLLDDTLIEVAQTYEIIASAPDFLSDTQALTVTDNDEVNLSLTINPTAINEKNGTAIATVTRDVVTNTPLQVLLSSDDVSEATVSPSVIIPAGEASATVEIKGVDDNDLDGNQTVTIKAQPTYTNTNLVTETGEATATVEVIDNETASLNLTIDRDLIAETGTATATVTRNTDTNNALVVTLTSSDETEATVDETVTIEANQTEATFIITGVNDGVSDGSNSVIITASATGLNDGTDSIEVSDIDVPDLVITELQAIQPAYTSQDEQLTYKVENLGLADTSGTWRDEVYLSDDAQLDEDDTLLVDAEITGNILVGSFYERNLTYYTPRTPGEYYLIAQTDIDNGIDEGLGIGENNNTKVMPFTVLAAYSAEVATDTLTAVAGDSVILSGTARSNKDNTPVTYEFVAIEVENNGLTRTFDGFTNGNGEFFYEFVPMEGEGGDYNIKAYFPDNPEEDATYEDSFKVLGAEFTEDSVSHRILADSTFTATIDLENQTDVPLTGITYELLGIPDTWDFQATVPDTLAGNGTNTINYTIEAPNESLITQARLGISIESNEGVTDILPINVNVDRIIPKLVSDTSPLNQAMLRGEQTALEFTITNEGGAAAENIEVLLPESFSWMSLATPSTIESLAPGESTDVTLLLTPEANIDLTVFNGNLFLDADGNDGDLSLPFSFRAISEAVGDINIDVVDELFFYTEEASQLEGARVILRDYFTNEVIYDVTTDASGNVFFDDVTEGYYKLNITADSHDSYSQTIQLEAGELENIDAFLPTQTVEYSWTVTPIEIEDRYEITIETIFETNVPIPTVVIEPGFIDLAELQVIGQVMQVDMTVTNHGLIAAEGIDLSIGTHPFYEFEPLLEEIDSLPAKSSLTIPIRITRVGDFDVIENSLEVASLSSDLFAASSSAPCSISAGLDYFYECAGQQIKRAIPIPIINVEGDCSGNGGSSGPGGGFGPGGGGFGPGGGGGPNGGSSTVTVTSSDCDPCVQQNLQALAACSLTLLGCVPNPLSTAATVIACLSALGDGELTFGDGGCIPGPVGCVSSIIDCLMSICFGGSGGGSGGGGGGPSPSLASLVATATASGTIDAGF